MLSALLISAAISTSTVPCAAPQGIPYEPPRQESTLPVVVTLPRRKERLTRYERRHPNLTLKEKAAFRRLAGGKR